MENIIMVKDYHDDLDESEYKHFSGAIIVISFIVICGLITSLILALHYVSN